MGFRRYPGRKHSGEQQTEYISFFTLLRPSALPVAKHASDIDVLISKMLALTHSRLFPVYFYTSTC